MSKRDEAVEAMAAANFGPASEVQGSLLKTLVVILSVLVIAGWFFSYAEIHALPDLEEESNFNQ